MKVYGLLAKGPLSEETGIEGQFRTNSRKVFTTKSAAENHIEEFIKNCCDITINPFYCADQETLKVSVIEFDVCER